MSTQSLDNHTLDLVRFAQNRERFPPEALVPYAGQHVAFSSDGMRIVAHGLDYQAVFSQLRTLGISISDVVFDYIPGLDEDTWL